MRLLSGGSTPPSSPESDNAIASGLHGEQLVIAALAASLDDRYALIHRLVLPGTTADLDLVVIASTIVVLEVKTYAAPRCYRCEGALWTYADRDEWWPLDAAPGTQAAYGARRVRQRLAGYGLTVPVRDLVVWAGTAPLELITPRVPVLRPDVLSHWLADLPPATPAREGRLRRALLASG